MGNALCVWRRQHPGRLPSRESGAAPSPTMIAASARLPTIDSGAAPSPTMIAASARLLSIETGIAPSPAMSRYDDRNGHPALGFIVAVPLALPSPAMSRYDDHNGDPALDFVPGRPLVDEPAAASPDEPSSNERLGRYVKLDYLPLSISAPPNY